MPRNRKMTRRHVLKLAAAAAATPAFVPGRVLGDDAPSKKVVLGSIGVGWMGGSNLYSFLARAIAAWWPLPTWTRTTCATPSAR